MKKKIILPIKKKWYDMILKGEKKEEYREIKPHYDSRLPKEFGMFREGKRLMKGNVYPPEDLSERVILFRNGYSRNSPSFSALCSLSIGQGKTEWGAEPGKEYYILTVREILKDV